MPNTWRHAAIVLVAVAAAAALLITLLADTDRSRVEAQTADTPTTVPTSAPVEGNAADVWAPPILGDKTNPPQYGKMDAFLNDLIAEVEQGVVSEQAIAAQAPFSDDQSVGVSILVEVGQQDEVKQYIEANGGSIRRDAEGYIEAYVPVSELAGVSELEGVINIETLIPLQPLQGDVVGEGAIVHGADVWQAAGFRGGGTKIGIVDLGFIGFDDAIGMELPTEDKLHFLCFDLESAVSSDVETCEYFTGHGTWVTENAFDIAPEATYYITNPITDLELREAIIWLVAHDVDVLNFSVGSTWDGPGDGTSAVFFPYSPLNTVDIAADAGILWVNAAGNEGESTWHGGFNDTDGDGLHNFAGDAECNSMLLPSEDRVIAQLRWADPWSAPETDLDLFLLDQRTGEVVRTSERFQIRYPIPYERIIFTPEVKGIYCLVVKKFSGADPEWLQVQAFTSQELQYFTPDHSIGNPAESAHPGMLAAGAAPWNNNAAIEPFSSRGPTTDGRTKPDIVGADFAYSGIRGGRWRGTSQAAPHITAMAALVKQLFPAKNNVELAEYLKEHAVERGDPGPDNTWGSGFGVLPRADAPTDICFTDAGIDEDIFSETGPSSHEVVIEGDWGDSRCLSINRPDSPRGPGNYYAQYYTLTILAEAMVTLELKSEEQDSYLYLMKGTGKAGKVIAEHEEPLANDSRIEIKLEPGDYTIEATTYYAEKAGRFTLTVEVAPEETLPPVKPDPDPDPADGGFVELSYGSDHACALHADGWLACWGSDQYGKRTPPEGEFSSVSSGEHGSCAIREDDGTVVCWGIFEVGLDESDDEE